MNLPEPEDGMRQCDFCEGMFVPADMNGDHCRDCADELFGECE